MPDGEKKNKMTPYMVKTLMFLCTALRSWWLFSSDTFLTHACFSRVCLVCPTVTHDKSQRFLFSPYHTLSRAAGRGGGGNQWLTNGNVLTLSDCSSSYGELKSAGQTFRGRFLVFVFCCSNLTLRMLITTSLPIIVNNLQYKCVCVCV